MTYEILGARGRIDDPETTVKHAQAWAANHGGEILLADASRVFGRDHLESAVRHALRAKARGVDVARSLSLETLRYLTAERQVTDAIRAAGLKAGMDRIAVVAFDAGADEFLRDVGWVRDDAVLDAAGKALRGLGITDAEEKTVPASRTADLALERTSLLDIEK